jgi:hypothetical protein
VPFSYNVAVARAATKHNLEPPSKSTIDDRAKKEGWQRHGNLNGINAAAHRKADTLIDSNGNRTVPDAQTGNFSNPPEPALFLASRQESEDKRAEVTARHRSEWKNIAVLRQEALTIRNTNPDGAMAKIKLAKLSAETTAIQQAGERKAWGLDIQVDMGSMKDLSDEQLESIIHGKVVY